MKLNLDKKGFWIPLVFLLLSTSTFAAITGETNPCRGVLYTYTYAGGNTCSSTSFSVSDGVFEDGSTSKFVSAESNGNFNIKVKWGTSLSGSISATSCTNTLMNLLVQIKGPSSVTLTPAFQTISNGNSVTLVASSPDGGPIYTFSCNTPYTCGSVSTIGSQLTVSPSATAIYTVTVSKNGCNKSATSTITVGTSNDPYLNSSVRLQGRYETVCGTHYGLFISGINGNILPYCCTVFEKRTTNGSWQTSSTNTDGPITEKTFYRAIHNGVISNTISREVTPPVSFYENYDLEPSYKDVFEGTLQIQGKYYMNGIPQITINAMEIRIKPNTRVVGSLNTLTLRPAACGMDLGYKNKSQFREGELDLYATVDNINKDNFISPNPATNSIKVSLSDSENATINIFDNKGILMLEKSVDQKDNHIDVSILEPGFYILKSIQNGNITNQKFVISE